ncbi:YphA family membrane protein [Paenibacillus methanolicus]|uniref:Uncharacterized protein n=1 Tax=Paenibacillus methanolicus TaxID=582686 RepID=A0A5S5CIE7_9BACL|nr:hypothetical protein [Paenibacillus methanolicus]TYP77783.1 hypothetical protein BCM02_102348 [Paenibacillus methanolicus]
MGMNGGITAMWLLAMGGILYLTGWQRQVADDVPGWKIVVVLAGIVLLHHYRIPIGWRGIVVYGSAAWAMVCALVALAASRSVTQSLFASLCALLSGTVWLWVRYMYESDPVFVFLRPELDGPVLAGFLAGMLTETIGMHLFVVTAAAAIAPMAAFYLPAAAARIEIGSLVWWDGMAVSLVGARLTWNVKDGLRAIAKWLGEGRSGERGGSV